MSETPTQSETTDSDAEPPVASGAHWASWLRNGVLLVVLLGMLWLVFHVDMPTIDQLRVVRESWGMIAWVAFILFYAIIAITPIPVTIMAVAGGVLFGVIEGSILFRWSVRCWGAGQRIGSHVGSAEKP